jgi:UDP-N-acetylmuramate--alanine ligase
MIERHLKIFFSGIGGSGMSALACFMCDKGHLVAGSDRAFDQDPSHPVAAFLRSKKVQIVPQDGSGIDSSLDLAVFSTAVEPDSPEFVKTKELSIRNMTRPEYLAEIVRGFKTIAVAGTSGKSTVSGMLAFLMNRLGLDPNFIGGGRVKQFHTAANPGNSLSGKSDYLVIEACESDGSIVNYRPLHSIILNLELDHHSVEETAAMFRVLKGNTSGRVVVNGDDDNLRKLRLENTVAFSIEGDSDFRAVDISDGGFGTEFTVGEVRFRLSIPGRHNVLNALSCIALLDRMGVSLGDIATVLHEFQGIERRFDVIINDGKRLVVDDYAHNPHKISALIETMSAIKERVCYIFQPHGFSPTRLMKKGYIDTFTNKLRHSDHLILLPIYYAGGTAARDISSYDLADGIKPGEKSVQVVETREDLLDRIEGWDAVVVLGARDETLSLLAGQIAKRLTGTSVRSRL